MKAYRFETTRAYLFQVQQFPVVEVRPGAPETGDFLGDSPRAPSREAETHQGPSRQDTRAGPEERRLRPK